MIAVLALAPTALPAGAQEPLPAGAEGWRHPWVAAFSLGVQPGLAREFGGQDPCRAGETGAGGELRAALRRTLGAHLALEGALGFTRRLTRSGDCLIVAPFPPNRTGTEVRTGHAHGTADGRFLTTGARVVGRIPSAHDTEFRFFGGITAAPSHRVVGPSAGAGVSFGTGPLRFLFEGEGWLHAFPMRTVTREWEDGRVVDRHEERFRGEWRRAWTFRAGAEVHLGALGHRGPPGR